MINIGVIGYGYWGPNLVYEFNETQDLQVSHVADKRGKRLEIVHSRYPKTQVTTDAEEVINNSKVDAVAIATPVSSHYDLALKALKAGKHVLVEKPMADTSDKCKQLIDEANKRSLLLMVDHTFPYTGAIRKIRELIAANELGDIFYYDSVRVNLGLFQHDVSVIWDLAVHDLSILEFLLTERPVLASATGMSHIKNQPENVAYITLFFNNNTIAHIHVNWLAPVKVRQTLIGGDKKMLVYNDLEPTEKVRVYDRGVTMVSDDESIYQMRVGYRTGDMWAPKLDDTTALRTLTRHFKQCLDGNEEPITTSASGLRVVQMMEAATRSMTNNGNPEKLL